MTVKNGEIADENTFNTSFVSREDDSNMIGVLALENAGSGANVANTQQAINDNIDNISTAQADILTNAANIAINRGDIDSNDIDIAQNASDIADINDPLTGAPKMVGGLIQASNLPSFVEDVEEYANFASLPAVGETGKLYVTLDTNLVYRWTGSIYIEVSASDVTSVNGQTADVVLTAADIDETGLRKYDSVIHNRNSPSDPLVTNDSSEGYAVGSTWFNRVDEKKFTLKDATVGAAVWIETGGGEGGGVGSPFTYYVEHFETNDASTFSVSGTIVVSNQTVNPLYGSRTIQIRGQAGTTGDTALYDVAIPIQQGQKETFNYFNFGTAAGTIGADGVYRVKIAESVDDITYTDIDDYFVDFTISPSTEIITLPFKVNSTSNFIKPKFEVIQETTLPQEDLWLDNFEFTTSGTQSIVFDNITEWQSYTPTFVGIGTPTNVDFRWRQVGENLEIKGDYNNGTVNGSIFTFSIPSGLTMVDYGNNPMVGSATVQASSPAADRTYRASATTVGISQSGYIGLTGTQLGTGNISSVDVFVPVNEFSATGSGVVTRGQQNQGYREKFLTSQITSNGDITDLQFDNLEVGNWYRISGHIVFDSLGPSAHGVGFFSSAGGTGTNYGFATNEGTGAAAITRGEGLNFEFQAKSTTMYAFGSNLSSNRTVTGTGGRFQTWVGLTPINDPTVLNPTVRDIITGQEYETGEKIDGKTVYARDYVLTADVSAPSTVATIDSNLIPVRAWNINGDDWLLSQGPNFTAASSSSSELSFQYQQSTGNVRLFVVGFTARTGTSFKFEYTKP